MNELKDLNGDAPCLRIGGEVVEENIVPVEVPVDIGPTRYILVEADEATACAHQNALFKAAKFNTDGKPTGLGDGMAEAEPILVSGCLFELYQHQGGTKRRPVTLIEVKSWLHRVVKPIYDKARKISKLDRGATASDLKKQVESLNDRLKKLREQEEAQEDPGKNSLNATAATMT